MYNWGRGGGEEVKLGRQGGGGGRTREGAKVGWLMLFNDT